MAMTNVTEHANAFSNKSFVDNLEGCIVSAGLMNGTRLHRRHLESLAGVRIHAAGDAGVEGVQDDTLHVCVRQVEQVVQTLVPAGATRNEHISWQTSAKIEVASAREVSMLSVSLIPVRLYNVNVEPTSTLHGGHTL